MPESLLNKYPHLKLLLNDSREKRSNLTEGREEATDPSQSIGVDEASDKDSLRHNDDFISRPRKSILGPGVGARVNRELPLKPVDLNRWVLPVPSRLKIKTLNLWTFFSRRKVTAEELYVESLASDNDQWLFFQIEKIPASLQMEQLRMWLATNRPSQARITL